MTVARLHRVPLARSILESAPPLDEVGAVLSVARSVLRLDHPEALLREQTEAVGVVLHVVKIVPASDRPSGPYSGLALSS